MAAHLDSLLITPRGFLPYPYPTFCIDITATLWAYLIFSCDFHFTSWSIIEVFVTTSPLFVWLTSQFVATFLPNHSLFNETLSVKGHWPPVKHFITDTIDITTMATDAIEPVYRYPLLEVDDNEPSDVVSTTLDCG
jgi:hypothetical protein